MSDFRPCRECEDWNKCLLTASEKEWFGYQDIAFCPIQVFWLCKYEQDLRGFRWPVLDDSGGISIKALPEAAFAKVSLILADLDSRLGQAGWRGKLLKEECQNPRRGCLDYLSNDAKRALRYVTGPSRRNTPFAVWEAKRRYRNYPRVQIAQT